MSEHPACDHCGEPAGWRAFACYPIESGDRAHTLVARYPMPMVRACASHLTVLLDRDRKPGATPGYVVEPISSQFGTGKR